MLRPRQSWAEAIFGGALDPLERASSFQAAPANDNGSQKLFRIAILATSTAPLRAAYTRTMLDGATVACKKSPGLRGNTLPVQR